MTKRYKLDRVASVDNKPPPDKNFGPKQMCQEIGTGHLGLVYNYYYNGDARRLNLKIQHFG